MTHSQITLSNLQITLSPQDIEATNAVTESRQAHWLQVKADIKELRATNGIGWAVHALLPAGWTQIGMTRETSGEALADLACKDESIEELCAYEVLA